MKRCPTCQKTFTDQHLTFCTDDGTPLVSFEEPADETSSDESTRVRASLGGESAEPASSPTDDERASAYQPPGSYVPPGYSTEKRRAWPWILGILVVVFVIIVGLGIAAAILIPNMMRASSNRSINLNANVDRRGNSNYNVNQQNDNPNSNSAADHGNNNDNSDDSDVDDTTPPPTDQEAVLAELKKLEDEWTVANINADKKKLNLILADDYVGTSEGRSHGKAEYLKTIKRDTSIQRWEFEDLKVSLKDDRASLTGILRLDVKDQRGQNQQLLFRFTDKFVWRDGRWQATASQVDPLPVKPGTTI